MWLGGVVVGSWTRDREVAGSTPGRCIVGQQTWASCSHQCASVYQAVPCEGFHVDAPFVAANGMKSNEQGGIVEAILQRSDRY